MQNWSIRSRLVAAFAMIVTLIVTLGGVSYLQLDGMRKQAADLRGNVLPGVLLSGELSAVSKDLLPAVITRATATDAAAKGRAAATVDRVLAELTRLEGELGRSVVDADDRAAFDGLRQSHQRFGELYRRALADDQVTMAEIDGELRTPIERLVAQGDSLVAMNRAHGESATQDIVDDARRSLAWLAAIVVASALVALGSGWLLARIIQQGFARLMAVAEVMRAGDFRQRVPIPRRDELGQLGAGINQMADDLTSLIARVQQSGIQVNSSATEIAATSKQQQATATEIAATTAEVGATAARISATSKELVKTMDDVGQGADQAAALAEAGQSGLSRMASSMQQIGEASALINSRLALLSEKAANIGMVVTTITKVADQTNLLSLNAAIEAEKAGEHGRGFTVVAREIRRLADQTAGATSDIEQLVREMQSAVSAGVMGMDKFSDEVRRGREVIGQVTTQLSEIIEQVQTLTPSFEAVNEGVKSQSVGAEQISDALSQLSVAAQQTADSLRQSNVAIEQLNDAARGLQTGVSRFTLAGA